ncbi:MAG: creatininase family protein [Candidatus Zixiibacteriota bacterium]|nr:MAG: creatininase family protein [candidate division Zixibacteria bacterium]
MSGRILRFEELNSPAIAELDKYKTAVFLAVSPIEGHGPHLPLGVDYFDALYFADKAAELTTHKRPDFDALIYPGIPLGTQLYRQSGSIRVESGTFYDMVTGIGNSLALWGFKYVFLLSGHGSPKDIVALESACVKVSKKHKIQMHNLSGALAIRFLKGEFIDKISNKLSHPLTENEKVLLKKDIHGGWWETSMMLRLKPDFVDDRYKSLPDNEKTKGASGSNPGYFGSPSRASREFAEASIDVLIDEVGSIIEKCLSGKDITPESVSPLYNIKPLRPKFKRLVVMWTIIVIKSLVILWLIYRLLIR